MISQEKSFHFLRIFSLSLSPLFKTSNEVINHAPTSTIFKNVTTFRFRQRRLSTAHEPDRNCRITSQPTDCIVFYCSAMEGKLSQNTRGIPQVSQPARGGLEDSISICSQSNNLNLAIEMCSCACACVFVCIYELKRVTSSLFSLASQQLRNVILRQKLLTSLPSLVERACVRVGVFCAGKYESDYVNGREGVGDFFIWCGAITKGSLSFSTELIMPDK